MIKGTHCTSGSDGSLLRGLVDLGRSGPPEIEAVCAQHKGGGGDSLSDGNLLLNGAPPPSCAPAPRSPANEHCELEEGELLYHLSSSPQTMRMQADRQARLSYHFSCLLHMHSRAGVIMPQTTWGKYWCIDRRGRGLFP